MKIKKRLWLIVVVFVALAPLLMADTGPKPGMDFALEYEISPAPQIAAVTLLECQQADCSDAAPLEELGPQGIWCDSNTECRSMAYGYNGEYFQLVLEFDDGTSLNSNIFVKTYFNSRYAVTVQADTLLVEEVGGSGDPGDFFSQPGCSFQPSR